ncbi:RluA family pseudouridine synthase [Lentimicrobium sp. L6]|uniref:RluA family pseudouridine synthase n=1 Tax=Lentimicrobium sp. L6 TaxID=2735916 RepID=UPI001C12F271|nr:RluA family pseudouridine synthase [Lentimicrobium sp. L6]
MQKKRIIFSKPSKKHAPKGMVILYEDQDIIVVNKESGLLAVSTDKEKDKTAHFILNDYVKKGNARSKNRVFIVHRLDRDTSGILVFAKSEKVKRYLQDEWATFSKTYFAVVHGQLDDREGEMISYLAENKVYIVYSVKDPAKGKLAKTGYKVLKESGKYSLLEIQLFTGRKNQIRVHLAEKEHPVLGDKVYGRIDKGIKRLTLHAASLTLFHPLTNEEMTFDTEIPQYFKTLVNYKA